MPTSSSCNELAIDPRNEQPTQVNLRVPTAVEAGPYDSFDPGEIDGYDAAAVKAALYRMHPFADIFSDEGITEQCRLGQGANLLSAFAPHMDNDAELTRLREWIESPISSIQEIVDLEERAWAIVLGSVYATDDSRRALIESVKDAGIIGTLAQANLQAPMQRTRKGWPWWYRPLRPSTARGFMPNLFTVFGER